MSATSQVPCSTIIAIPSSSIRLPCSIESTPARTAFLIPWAPWAWAATLRPAAWRLLDRGAELLDGELRCAGRVAPRQHPADGVDLDHVDAVLELRPDDVAHLVGAVGDPVVALARGTSTRGPAGRSGSSRRARRSSRSPGPLATIRGPTTNPSSIDSRRSTARNGRPAQVAHRGEPGLQRRPRVLHGRERAVERGVLELVDLVEAVGPGAEVGVAVDQAGQDRSRRTGR